MKRKLTEGQLAELEDLFYPLPNYVTYFTRLFNVHPSTIMWHTDYRDRKRKQREANLASYYRHRRKRRKQMRIYGREYYRTHREERKAYDKEYYRTHLKQIKAYNRQRYEQKIKEPMWFGTSRRTNKRTTKS